jgi:hypothetical protein
MHLSHVKSQVSKGLGMLKCCYRFLPKSCLLALYYSFVYPYLSAGIEFWGCCSKVLFNELLILQKKCIRIISGAGFLDHCAPLAKQCDILMLNDLYDYSVKIIMFKVFSSICCPTVSQLFLRCNNAHNVCTRSALYNFYVYPCRTNIRRNFVANHGVQLWNLLPTAFRECMSLCVFKKLIRKHILSTYV